MGSAYAQGTITVTRPSSMRISDIGTLVSGAIGLVFLIAGLIIFAFLVFGGILYMTSSGDKTQADRGKQAITGAALGFVIIAISYAIVLLLEYFFGITILEGIIIPKSF